MATTGAEFEAMRDAWYDYTEATYALAENATNGVLLNRAHRDEFLSRFGPFYVTAGLFSDFNAATAYRYASEELVSFWAEHPRQTWPEFAVAMGCRRVHIVRAARRAPGARAAAEGRALNYSRSGLLRRAA